MPRQWAALFAANQEAPSGVRGRLSKHTNDPPTPANPIDADNNTDPKTIKGDSDKRDVMGHRYVEDGRTNTCAHFSDETYPIVNRFQSTY